MKWDTTLECLMTLMKSTEETTVPVMDKELWAMETHPQNGPVALFPTLPATTNQMNGETNVFRVSDCRSFYPIILYSSVWVNKLDWNLLGWAAYCGDACPGGACTLSVDDICQNPKPYGGCNGRYKDYFDQFCKKTCGLC